MDKALKQRLVGASVLIALAVIVLPMLLSGRPESSAQQSQKIELPPRPGELSFETRRFPVTDPQENARPAENHDTAAIKKLPAVSGAAAGKADENVAPQESHDGSQAVTDSMPAQAPVGTPPANPDPASPAPGGTSRYVVQVASLGSTENASRLMTSLQGKGFPVLFDTVDSDVGQLNRIRVGPYEDETEAAQVSARIGKELEGVSPRVVDLQPDQSAPVTKPADPLVRWVVQVGSFADSSNAERLVTQIKGDGMSAYSETVTSSASSIFRVRVGPFLEREEAMRTKQQLSDRLSIDGVVVSAD